jgi:hypothetical protein
MHVFGSAEACQRAGDRRSGKPMTPPPYQTIDGLILVDRRSQQDRRASWLREFSLDFGFSG